MISSYLLEHIRFLEVEARGLRCYFECHPEGEVLDSFELDPYWVRCVALGDGRSRLECVDLSQSEAHHQDLHVTGDPIEQETESQGFVRLSRLRGYVLGYCTRSEAMRELILHFPMEENRRYGFIEGFKKEYEQWDPRTRHKSAF